VRVLTPSDRYVPWIHDLPSGWVVNPLKYWVDINCEALPESTDGGYEFRYIDISCVTTTGQIYDPELLTFDTAPTRARRIVRKGDTIVSTVRTYLKAIAFIDDDSSNLVCSTGFAVLRPYGSILPKFLFYWTRSSYFVDEVCARSVGVGYPAINALEIGSLPIPILPQERQAKMVKYLDRRLESVDSLIAIGSLLVTSSSSNGGLITEYRDSLITAVMSGKIDVRGEVV